MEFNFSNVVLERYGKLISSRPLDAAQSALKAYLSGFTPVERKKLFGELAAHLYFSFLQKSRPEDAVRGFFNDQKKGVGDDALAYLLGSIKSEAEHTGNSSQRYVRYAQMLMGFFLDMEEVPADPKRVVKSLKKAFS